MFQAVAHQSSANMDLRSFMPIGLDIKVVISLNMKLSRAQYQPSTLLFKQFTYIKVQYHQNSGLLQLKPCNENPW